MAHKETPTVLIGVTIARSLNFHYELARALKESGCSVHLVSSDGPKMDELSREFTTHVLPMERNPNPVQDIKSFVRWLRLLSHLRPEVVLVGTPKASLLGLVASKITRVPTRLYFIHGLRLETFTGTMRKILYGLEWVALACATKTIAVSPSVRSTLLSMKLTKAQKVVVLGQGSANGIDLSTFRPSSAPEDKNLLRSSLGLITDRLTIGYMGRLTTEKGVAELRDALLHLQASGLIFQVLLVGEAEDNLGATVEQDLREGGIHVVAPGRVTNPEVYFRAMDIFCLPTHREGLGNVILEAFASGIPVVSTRVTGVVDLVKHQQTGILVPAGDAMALSRGIQTLVTNRNLARRLEMTAGDYVRKNFDSERVIEKQKEFILKEWNTTTDKT